MNTRSKHYPACFANIDIVFPKGEDGMRQSPESCFPCYYKTECLRKALQGKQGIQVHQDVVDRAYESGMIGFLQRWSRKKALQTAGKKKEKEMISRLL